MNDNMNGNPEQSGVHNEEALKELGALASIQVNPESLSGSLSVEDAQSNLDQAGLGIINSSNEIDLFDSLGRLVENSDRVGTQLSLRQRADIEEALTGRGYKDIDQYLEDNEYTDAMKNNPNSVEGQGIAGNILKSIRSGTPIPQVGADFAFKYRDRLIAEQKAAEGNPS